MAKYLVEALNPGDKDEPVIQVYHGDDPKFALFAWAILSYCAPKKVSIKTTTRSSAYHLVMEASANMEWFKEQCSLEGFPYDFEVIRNSVEYKCNNQCLGFNDSDIYESVFPFNAR